MNYIGNFISNFKDFYNEINAATLTGAIDVVVVQQEDGGFTSSPFHVRFGKLGVLRSREKVVDIEINDSPVDIRMKLGESGEAFFVEEVEEDAEYPDYLATSPIPPGMELREHIHKMRQELEEVERTGQKHITSPEAVVDNSHSHDITSKKFENIDGKVEISETGGGEMQENNSDEVGKKSPLEKEKNFDDSVKEKDDKESQDSILKEQNNDVAIVGQRDDSKGKEGNIPKDYSSANSVKTFVAETVESGKIVCGFLPISSDESSCLQGNVNQSVAVQTEPIEPEHKSGESRQRDTKPGILPTEETKIGKRKRRRRSLLKKKQQKSKDNQSLNIVSEGHMNECHGSCSTGSDRNDREEEIFEIDDVESSYGVSDDKDIIGQPVDQSVTGESKTSSIISTAEPEENKESIGSSVPSRMTRSCTIAEQLSESSSQDETEWIRMTRSMGPNFHFFSDTEISPVCSPLGSRPSSPVQSDTEYEMKRHASIQTEDENQRSWKWGELPSPVPKPTPSHTPNKDASCQEETVSSDAEKAKKEQEDEEQRSMLSGMFSFMRKTKKIRHNPEAEGIYLDDINLDDLDPEIAALYFPTTYRNVGAEAAHLSQLSEHTKDDDAESGNGPSLPHSPVSVEGANGGTKFVDSDFEDSRHFDYKGIGDVALSLCGGLKDYNEQDIPSKLFDQSIVSYDDFIENPTVIEDPNLVVRFGGKYYNWKTASPILLSNILYQRSLPHNTIETLVKQFMPKEKEKEPESKSYRYWFHWGRKSEPKKSEASDNEIRAQKSENHGKLEEKKTDEDKKLEVRETEIKNENGKKSSCAKGEKEDVKELNDGSVEESGRTISVAETQTTPPGTPKKTPSQRRTKGESLSTSSEAESDQGKWERESTEVPIEKREDYESTEKFRKSLRLTSEQIMKLNLQEGANEAVFSVTTAYQGTTRCKCHIYFWKFDDKIVVSDIDGTITKSDVLGHILPIIGKDWAQSGVAQLFTKVKNNGYRILYLSARAIGQARITRDYLKSIKQGDLSLPDGPLLLNPTSLLSAFHREVIEKKPEEFKIFCLRDIQALYPHYRNPFYAGYGNKINDVWAYRAVGIPISRIFTINHKGELKHELTQTFQSSYCNQSYIVDHIFPPLQASHLAENFSQFIYWRDPIPDISIDSDKKATVEVREETDKEKK